MQSHMPRLDYEHWWEFIKRKTEQANLSFFYIINNKHQQKLAQNI